MTTTVQLTIPAGSTRVTYMGWITELHGPAAAYDEPLPPEPVAEEDREPDLEEPEDADDAMYEKEDPRIARAEMERDHATNDDAPVWWGG